MSDHASFRFLRDKDLAYAVNLIETVTWLAGKPDYLDDLRETVQDLDLFSRSSGRARSTRLFEWLAAKMSFQGISDQVAESYMTDHGRPRWGSIAKGVKTATCPLLKSYWHFHGCRYRKLSRTCALPALIDTCPLPQHHFRNGNLNQLAYSLFLFIRDVADGDLVAWIDGRLAEADHGPDRIRQMADAIIEPLAGVHGVAGKVLNMVLADLLVVGNSHNPRWGEVGGALIAIDTLVHNFMARTGILKRAKASHPYGPRCYGPAGCAAIISAVSEAIDARQFNCEFPQIFPRYIQRAIWAYCAEEGLAVCNGRAIEDCHRCKNRDCRLYNMCDRVVLRPRAAKKALIFKAFKALTGI